MNAIYGLCWSATRGCFIVVSEVAKRRGKKSSRRSLLVLTTCFFLANGLAGMAHAGDITFTNADFSSPLTTGWTQGGGTFTIPLPSPYIMDPSNYTTGTPTNSIITSSANDPLVPVSMTYNSQNSVRVNDSNNDQSNGNQLWNDRWYCSRKYCHC